MNYPPAPPAPMSAPPPPPVPPKSSALKWILIGCGVAGGIGILACAGCGIFIYLMVQKYKPLVEEATAFIRANPVIKEELGDIKKVDLDHERSSLTDTTCRASMFVEGTKNHGTIAIELRKEGGRWKVVEGKLMLDGRTIELKPPPA